MRNKIVIISLVVAVSSCFSRFSFANNLSLTTDALVTSIDTSAGTAVINFDISWDNSFRDSTNYDAVWIFMKFKTGSTWNHATLFSTGTNPSGYSTGSDGDSDSPDNDDIEIVVPSDSMGWFIQRSLNGTGTLDRDDVQIVWDYNADDVAAADVDNMSIRIFGIEMIYVPQGAFYLGDGNGTSESTRALHQDENIAVLITSLLKNGINTDGGGLDDAQLTSPGIGIDGDGGLDTDNDGDIDNPDFPTGYTAFYMMKYELSQGQYRDFLNTLDLTQQDTRVADTLSTLDAAGRYVMPNSSTVKNRNFLRAGFANPVSGSSDAYVFGCDYALEGSVGDKDFDTSADGEWVAINYISYPDAAAYADWAALRMVTTLEWEKAGRGPNAPVLSEYSWGTTEITDSGQSGDGPPQNPGETNELPDRTGNGLCNYDSGTAEDPDGPMRCGFASTASSTRLTSGAGYYGAMEMTGNLDEHVIEVADSTGRIFQGSHGDGVLSSNGNATNSDWPGYSDGEVTVETTGWRVKGGDWKWNGGDTLSERQGNTVGRISSYGIRLGRTAP